MQQGSKPASLCPLGRNVGRLVDRLKQEHLTGLLVNHLSCGNIEHKTWGVAVFLSLDSLLILAGSLGGLALSRHLGSGWVVLGHGFAVSALQTVQYQNKAIN